MCAYIKRGSYDSYSIQKDPYESPPIREFSDDDDKIVIKVQYFTNKMQNKIIVGFIA